VAWGICNVCTNASDSWPILAHSTSSMLFTSIVYLGGSRPVKCVLWITETGNSRNMGVDGNSICGFVQSSSCINEVLWKMQTSNKAAVCMIRAG
jgi:hypothetical protein